MNQKIEYFSKLNIEKKCDFAITIGKLASDYLNDNNAKGLVDEAFEIARQWNGTLGDIGEKLYYYLDNEENGFTLFQEMEDDEVIINAWNCIIDAIAYVSKAAYEIKGEKYLPEPIEIVDDNTISHMIQSLFLCDETKKDIIEKTFEKYI